MTAYHSDQADLISKLDKFLREKGEDLRHFDNLSDHANAKNGKLDRALEISAIIVAGISIISEIHPVVQGDFVY